MASKFSSGKNAIAQCDRCGFRFKLTKLKSIVIRAKSINILVCPECWEPDQPQNLQGMYPVNDPQAVRNPRPDTMTFDGSRVVQWGWNPVGANDPYNYEPNALTAVGEIGQVTVTT
jgi:hypothetical protein